MFCGCAVAPLNALPNTYVCEICEGMPGVLPVINKAAVEACLKTALALRAGFRAVDTWTDQNHLFSVHYFRQG